MFMQSLSHLAGVATETTSASADLGVLRSPESALHSGAALLLLLVATTLAVYKPRGMTRYGHRRQQQRRALARSLQRSSLAN